MVRSDLNAGSKACQAAHALREFAARYPEDERHWFQTSNTLVMLEAEHETLLQLEQRALAEGIQCVRFVEPDWSIAGVLTALALGQGARRLVSQLPLAFGPRPRAAPLPREG